jgi:tetratricopeptide (TPR) repeat protein/tRNA A-37 threonylcarbamoyl transferase component Bud32
VADWWAAAEEKDRLPLLRELIRVDVEQQRVRKETLSPDEYKWAADAYPQVDVRGMVAAEIAARAEPAAPPARPVPAIDGYLFCELLGAGGMGEVWLAVEVVTARRVAVKFLRADRSELRERFLREARALARLGEQPGVVRLFAVGEHDGRPYFTMEHCAGGSLRQRLGGRPLDPRQAADVLRQVAAAVHRIHDLAIVHRDLTPANILFDAAGRPLVSDLGLARLFDLPSLTAADERAVFGTVPYMAPEQAAGRGHEATWRTDVYALGAILYECLTGRPPFAAATVVDTLRQIADPDVEPVPPGRLNPAVPADLSAVCLKALNKHPVDRYPTAGELAEDLGCVLAGEPPRGVRRGTARDHQGVVERRARTAIRAAMGVVETVLALDPRFDRHRLDFLRIARDLLSELGEAGGVSAADRAGVAEAYRRVAEVDRRLGRHGQAEAGLSRAVALARDLIREHPAEETFTLTLARSCHSLAGVYADTSRPDDAARLFSEVLDLGTNRSDPEDTPPECGWETLRLNAHLDLGKLRHARGELADAERLYTLAVETAQSLLTRHPNSVPLLFLAAKSWYHLGLCHEYQRRPDQAQRCYERTLDVAELLADAPHDGGVGSEAALNDTHFRGLERLVPVNWARWQVGEEFYVRAVSVLERLLVRFPGTPAVCRLLAVRRAILAQFWHEAGRPDDAEEQYRTAVSLLVDLSERYPDLLEHHHELAITRMYFGRFLQATGRPAEAGQVLSLAAGLLDRLAASAPGVGRYADDLAAVRRLLAELRGN